MDPAHEEPLFTRAPVAGVNSPICVIKVRQFPRPMIRHAPCLFS